jgi:hypothetical protein
MDMVWKGVVGGLMTAAIVWLSRRGNTLPGILPLFPTFARHFPRPALDLTTIPKSRFSRAIHCRLRPRNALVWAGPVGLDREFKQRCCTTGA